MKFKTGYSISEWNTKQLDELLEEGGFTFTYGRGIKVFPSHRFITLEMALRGYYSTYETSRSGISEGSYEQTQRVYQAVVFMSLFLEQFIVEHFDEHDPTVSRNSKGRTNSFSRILEVLENRLNTERDSSVESLKFFENHIWAVKTIADLRNDLAHGGNRIPFIKLIDVLYVNHLSSLLIKLLEFQGIDYRAIDPICYCGVRVLHEFANLSLTDEDISKYNTFNNRKVNQLKALGKSAMNSPILLGLDAHEQEAYESINTPLKSLM